MHRVISEDLEYWNIDRLIAFVHYMNVHFMENLHVD